MYEVEVRLSNSFTVENTVSLTSLRTTSTLPAVRRLHSIIYLLHFVGYRPRRRPGNIYLAIFQCFRKPHRLIDSPLSLI